jgi:ssDNA-binding Zn-finger/Zn-ribbon topoisomerase 1
VLAGDHSWIVSLIPGGEWQTLTVVSPRFANAFAEVAGGAALTSIRSTADNKGSVVARFDRCATCGDEATLAVGRGYHVSIDCVSCGASRWPTLSELDAWAWAVGYRCPMCQSAVRAKRGKSRSFLSCASYPKCEGMAYLSDLVGRQVVPESHRPARPVAAAPTRKRSAPAPVSRARSGHKLADIAEFDDYGIDKTEAERWLDLGLKADHATDLIGAGFTPESVETQQAEGTEPLDLWRGVRRR